MSTPARKKRRKPCLKGELRGGAAVARGGPAVAQVGRGVSMGGRGAIGRASAHREVAGLRRSERNPGLGGVEG